MAGTIKLDGTTFLTKDDSNNFTLDVGSGGTISQGTIGSNVTFPGPPVAGTFKGGHILQVVNFELTGSVSMSSSTYQDTGLTASITPASASHKILIHLVHNTVFKNTNNTWANIKFFRDTTSLGNFAEVLGYTADSSEVNVGAAVLNYLDSPNTTSSVTYKTQINSESNNANVGFNRNGTKSYITLMEVVA